MGYEIRPSGYVADVKAKLFQVSTSSYETRGVVNTVDRTEIFPVYNTFYLYLDDP